MLRTLPAGHEAAAFVVADVAADDIGLVQAHVVVEDAHAAILVEVAVGNDDIAVAADQMDAVQGAADVEACQGQLHRAGGLDADCFRMGALDGQPVHQGHPLPLPDLLREARRIGRLEVRAHELERRTGTGHDDPRHPVTADRCVTDLVQLDHNRLRDAEGPLGQADDPGARIDRFLQCGGVVRLAIADRAELTDIAVCGICRSILLGPRASTDQQCGPCQNDCPSSPIHSQSPDLVATVLRVKRVLDSTADYFEFVRSCPLWWLLGALPPDPRHFPLWANSMVGGRDQRARPHRVGTARQVIWGFHS